MYDWMYQRRKHLHEPLFQELQDSQKHVLTTLSLHEEHFSRILDCFDMIANLHQSYKFHFQNFQMDVRIREITQTQEIMQEIQMIKQQLTFLSLKLNQLIQENEILHNTHNS